MKFRRYFILLLLTSALGGRLFGQSDSTRISKNTFYVELLGNGGFYSVNYDRLIMCKNKFKFSGRVGFSYVPPPLSYNNVLTIPLEATVLWGKSHKLEIGLAWTGVIRTYDEKLFSLYDAYQILGCRLGYRYQKDSGGFMIRTGVLPYIRAAKYFDPGWGVTLGLGIGWAI